MEIVTIDIGNSQVSAGWMADGEAVFTGSAKGYGKGTLRAMLRQIKKEGPKRRWRHRTICNPAENRPAGSGCYGNEKRYALRVIPALEAAVALYLAVIRHYSNTHYPPKCDSNRTSRNRRQSHVLGKSNAKQRNRHIQHPFWNANFNPLPK